MPFSRTTCGWVYKEAKNEGGIKTAVGDREFTNGLCEAICRNMSREIDMIAHSCGCRHARELKRRHVRIVLSANQSITLNMLYPYPAVGSGATGKPSAADMAA